MFRFVKWMLLAVAALLIAPPALFAQMDMTGAWAPRLSEDFLERIPGPELGDYLGLPITDGARQWALSWDPSRLTLPEHQCQVHVVAVHLPRTDAGAHLGRTRSRYATADRHQALHQHVRADTHHLDGRPASSARVRRPHMGRLLDGRFEGDMLSVTTTHIKQGWVRRNGLPESDRATLSEHFIRHGNNLTHISIVTDPVYLTEPLIKTNDFTLIERTQFGVGAWLWPCEYVDEIANRPQGVVPNYPVGKNPAVKEFLDRYHLPLDAAMGGAKTMYPEYQLELEKLKGK